IPELNLRVLGDIVELKPHVLKAEAHCAYLDGDRVAGSLSVRFFQPGDRFYPLGAPGHKKLKDFFIDQKIPRAERPYVPLVINREDIVWVVGHRIDEAYKVRPETQRVIRLQCEVCQAVSA
ncbi:MAG: tRNA lysidine(34) synthetase TilS, partial [bacterium]|nr:tRNA lysidine(34) synthetase TilS [bacterium]